MRTYTTYGSAVEYLNNIYGLLNDWFFESTLSKKPTITIQSTPRAYGHFSIREDTWSSGGEDTHEINIAAEYLDRPIALVVSTLLHEMVHYYCYLNGIKDCSRKCQYHNKKFKAAAEAHGLVVMRDKTYGWTITSPNDELLAFVHKNQLSDINISRTVVDPEERRRSGLTQSSTRKYVCPICGMSIRATKTVRVSCLDCGKQLVLDSFVR